MYDSKHQIIVMRLLHGLDTLNKIQKILHYPTTSENTFQTFNKWPGKMIKCTAYLVLY